MSGIFAAGQGGSALRPLLDSLLQGGDLSGLVTSNRTNGPNDSCTSSGNHSANSSVDSTNANSNLPSVYMNYMRFPCNKTSFFGSLENDSDQYNLNMDLKSTSSVSSTSYGVSRSGPPPLGQLFRSNRFFVFRFLLFSHFSSRISIKTRSVYDL